MKIRANRIGIEVEYSDANSNAQGWPRPVVLAHFISAGSKPSNRTE